MLFTVEPFWSPYAHVAQTVRTGSPAFDEVYGRSVYQYLQENPEVAKLFGATATTFHGQAMASIVASYDFSAYGVVVDVGGGSEALLVELLRAYPSMRGMLLELDSVLPEAGKPFQASGLGDRVEPVAGDFFAEVPVGDAYLIKSCLHNFGDEQAIELLRVIRRASGDSGAPVLIVETMIPAGNESHYSMFDDIEMMVIAGGNDRTEVEWSALSCAAGFSPGRVIQCDDRFSLLEAFPA